ncbi:MAG: ferredoxin reductase [Candidatus Limnocylindria bacterium]
MARTAVLRRLTWAIAEVVDRIDETPRVRSLTLDVPDWPGHLPGQHIDVRLTAEDGYQAQRSYSIATPADGSRVTITVERLDDGEVSPYLTDVLVVGDRIELRGPIGGYFVWESSRGGPLLLVAGGSGIAPLMAMLRSRVAARSDVPVRLLCSWRSAHDVIYADELKAIATDAEGVDITHTLTRTLSDGWTGRRGRFDRDALAGLGWPPELRPLAYVCGPTGFVEAVASVLVELGHDPARILTERFGPTGG